MAYTYEELLKMGAQPSEETSSGGFTYEQLIQMGASEYVEPKAFKYETQPIQITPEQRQSRLVQAQQESVLKSIAADPFRTLIEKPATAVSRVAALGIAKGADILGKDQFAKKLRTTALEKGVPSIIGGKEVEPIKPGAKGAKQITGNALQIGSYLFPYGKVASAVGGVTGSKLAGAVTSGATGTYLSEIGFRLEEGDTNLKPGAVTFLGGGIPVASSVIGKTSGAISKFKKPIPTTEETLGKIIQGKTTDKKLAQQALSNIDTKGVKTFDELSNKLSESMKNQMSIVDQELAKDAGIYKLNDLAVSARDNAGRVIKTDYVGEALKNLNELYTTTGDNVAASNIELLAQKAVKDGLTRQEVNNIARLYSEEFGSKGYSKLGEPLTSVNAQKFENVRSGLKESARAGLGGEEAKAADKLYSAMAKTKTLIDKNVEAVNRLKQRISERGTLEKLARGAVRTLDTLSGGTIRGAAQAVFPSNMGLKVQNFMQLEENLAKNLDLLNKANTAKTESAFVKFLNGLKFPGDEAVDNIGKRVDDFKKLPGNVKQGGYLNIGGQSENLIQEAKKYKSAEEFWGNNKNTIFKIDDVKYEVSEIDSLGNVYLMEIDTGRIGNLGSGEDALNKLKSIDGVIIEKPSTFQSLISIKEKEIQAREQSLKEIANIASKNKNDIDKLVQDFGIKDNIGKARLIKNLKKEVKIILPSEKKEKLSGSVISVIDDMVKNLGYSFYKKGDNYDALLSNGKVAINIKKVFGSQDAVKYAEIQTKSQLEEIWKQANKPKKPALPVYKGEKDLSKKEKK